MSKVVITRFHKALVAAGYQENRPIWFECRREDQVSILGNIYVAKVVNVVKNIQAAFVQISPEQMCYYSLKENAQPIFVKQQCPGKLVQGDEIIVQIDKEALKTKDPVVTSKLNVPGKYMALTTGEKGLGISKKLSVKQRIGLKEIFASLHNEQEPFGIVVRTNAVFATPNELKKEYEYLKQHMLSIVEKGIYRTVFTRLYEAKDFYMERIQDLPVDSLEKIVTDQWQVYEKILDYYRAYGLEGTMKERLVYYQDEICPLGALFNLSRDLERALGKQVWMKSGAYLVIEPTEALTVIDVNTGKYSGKNKDRQETFLKINLEAAKEAALQIRLRNLSGIILIDFVDLEQEEDRKTLMQALEQELQKDSLPVNLVELTKLQLAEITRKKVKKPLHEQISLKDLKEERI